MLGNAGGGKDPCFWCAGEGGNRAVIDDESTTPRTTVTFRSRCVAVRSEKSSVSSLGTMWWGPLAWVLRWKQSESWMFEMDTSSLMSGEGKRVGSFWFRYRALPRLYASASPTAVFWSGFEDYLDSVDKEGVARLRLGGEGLREASHPSRTRKP